MQDLIEHNHVVEYGSNLQRLHFSADLLQKQRYVFQPPSDNPTIQNGLIIEF